MLLGLCLRAWKHRKAGHASLDMVEFFAGSGNLALDKLCGEHHDVRYPQGIRLWVDALSNTVCDSLNWFATRCSSFVMLCAAQAAQKEENQFWGDTSRLFIVEGNHLCNVTSLLFFISYLLMNVPCLEQPADSVLAKVSTMQLVQCTDIWSCLWGRDYHTQSFGGETTIHNPLLRHSQIHMLHSIWVNHRAHPRADALQLGNTMFDLALLAAIPNLLTKTSARPLCPTNNTASQSHRLHMQLIVRCKPRLIGHI